ncbi:MAG: hypothetical protein M3N19_11060 [Candidatus Eremiobacteraeota bacterium]|nr:hypothetical protein [Candidatus Eremiobacteraeota bacterium]
MIQIAVALLLVAFFPAPPAHQPLRVARGTLQAYSIGNAEGHLSVRNAAGEIQSFFVGYPMRINGRITTCLIPPPSGVAPMKHYCTDWPATLVVGKSRVSVHYWTQFHGGQQVQVTDALTYGR